MTSVQFFLLQKSPHPNVHISYLIIVRREAEGTVQTGAVGAHWDVTGAERHQPHHHHQQHHNHYKIKLVGAL